MKVVVTIFNANTLCYTNVSYSKEALSLKYELAYFVVLILVRKYLDLGVYQPIYIHIYMYVYVYIYLYGVC